MINATCDVFNQIATVPQFMPSARKFHYQFNLRDFARIVQNMMSAVPQLYRGAPEKLIRMWAHEMHRVYLDRFTFEEDREKYMEWMRAACKHFDNINPDIVFEEPLIYTSFVSACEGHDKAYLPVRDMPQLKRVLEDKLMEYNDTIQSMNLVLFDQAMEHICRICRIIDLPAGNALLIGVGGSGK